MFGLGTKELIIILVIAILLFGSKRIPELARHLVEAVKHITGSFKRSPNASDDTKKKNK